MFNNKKELSRWKRSQKRHKYLSNKATKRGKNRLSTYHKMIIHEQLGGTILSKRARKDIYRFCMK